MVNKSWSSVQGEVKSLYHNEYMRDVDSIHKNNTDNLKILQLKTDKIFREATEELNIKHKNIKPSLKELKESLKDI
jgi:hypothetical protein